MIREIQLTDDGSHTLFIPEMDEHYHSVNGAIQEAKHVYLEAGFRAFIASMKEVKQAYSVLELGFGTGLNALLTALEAEKNQVKVIYSTLEKYPLSQEIISQLNYSQLDSFLFEKIHKADWNKKVAITPYFTLQKIQVDFNEYDFPECYDLVYYDAFAPDKQDDVWSQNLFDTIHSQMNPGGILTTYCAKGEIRRKMQGVGFTVERIPGPPGKREMLRAKKQN